MHLGPLIIEIGEGYLTFLIAQFASFQWLVAWYPMGKTSNNSRFNIPGRIGFALMETPGFITLLYLMFSLPVQNGIESLPTVNWLMAGLFVSSLFLHLSKGVGRKMKQKKDEVARELGNCFVSPPYLTYPNQSLTSSLTNFPCILTDNPLHLSLSSLPPLPKPLHVTHPSFHIPLRALLPTLQRHLPRRLARVLWSPDKKGLGGARPLDRSRHDRLRPRPIGQHLSRR